MATGGRVYGIGRSRRGLPLALAGLALTATMAATSALGSSAAYGVSTAVPTATGHGAFVFGKNPVRPEITRRVVATQNEAIGPLPLLFRIASGKPAPATHVLSAAPGAPAPPSSTPASSAAPTPTATVGVPAMGHAYAWGCAAAIAYLSAYAAPGFTIECPGNAGGHEATTTCISGATLCGDGASIVIADPCPAAYMNEASNSWVLIGVLRVPIDPYGQCP